MNCRFIWTVCFVSLVAAPMAFAEEAEAKKIGTIEGITEYRLENGLQVLLYPDASKPTVTVNVTYLVGSRHEGYGESGMAHLLEHMLLRGLRIIPTFRKCSKSAGLGLMGRPG